MKKNIVMIGMPGSGKSSVGRNIAAKLGMSHIDGDAIMEQHEGMKLCDIIRTKGNDYVLDLEERVLCDINTENFVISPGGSCIYYPKAMEHLREIADVVYLQVDWDELEIRCKDPVGRGVIFKPGETLKSLYDLRTPLYEKWADYVVNTSSCASSKEAAEKVLNMLDTAE